MIKRMLLIPVLFLTWHTIAFCQSGDSLKQGKEIQLIIGDSLMLGNCTNEPSFKYIDLMIKTRWPESYLTYNKETGEGFYKWYFNGDIDSGRLPCKYAGQKFRVASIHQYNNEDGSIRTVLFGQVNDEKTVLWIEITDAIESGEVIAW